MKKRQEVNVAVELKYSPINKVGDIMAKICMKGIKVKSPMELRSPKLIIYGGPPQELGIQLQLDIFKKPRFKWVNE